MLDFLIDHPGAVCGGTDRRRYADVFRLFVLDLWQRHDDIEVEAFALAVRVPQGTLKDWFTGGACSIENTECTHLASAPDEHAKGPRIEQILAAYKTWKGSFAAFCDHVQLHLHIPWGRTLIADVLDAEGVRPQKRRRGRRPDENALRKGFESFFPGAVWSADGSPIRALVDGVPYAFNVELAVDAHTDGYVGFDVRDAEDGAAVVAAFEGGVHATGAPPLALLLDNRPANHTDEVARALGDTMKIRRTPGRPQNGAHVEGGFGLFAQRAPRIELETGDKKELARRALVLQFETWARTLNHRPQQEHEGRSRVQRYREDRPTPEEVEAARQALAERQKKQELSAQTRHARLDPVVRGLLDEAFARLGLEDPDGNLRDSIAGFPLDRVLDGLAVFEGRRRAGTLPEGVDGRYLLGIVRHISDEEEGVAIAEALFELRRTASDRVLLRLDEEREAAVEQTIDPIDLVASFVDRAMATDRFLDRSFWITATADVIEAQPDGERRDLFRLAARRIHATHRLSKKERQAATRRLAARVLPIA